MTNNAIIQPYLFFDGKCEEAIEFYKKVLGAEVDMLLRYKDSPEPPPPGCGPTDPNKVMHASFRIGETQIRASDGRATGNPKFEGFALSLTVKTEAEADKAFNALANGGKWNSRWQRRFSRRNSAWWWTSSACSGWSWSRRIPEIVVLNRLVNSS
jgi:PhnB protein